MSRSVNLRWLWSMSLVLSLGACPSNPATDAGEAMDLGPATRGTRETLVDLRLKRDLDILFMVDNSTSMSPKQRKLAEAIGGFITQVDATGANYHVGVVTSDIGTLPPPGNMFPGANDPRCGTLKGDDGLLQNTSCRLRTTGVSPEFTVACNSLCPAGTAVPSQRWIAKDNGVTNVPDPIAAFKCIGLVGDSGCGVESPLESVKRALDRHLIENTGFLRDNSVLAVIFITDEDDCSVQLTQRNNLNPQSMDCGMSNPDPAYGCYNLDYRCLAKDIQCNEPLSTVGPKTGCKERTTTFLEPIDKYSRFLSMLRPTSKLVLGGIWSPSLLDFEAGITTPFGNGQLQVGLDSGTAPLTNVMNRAQRTQAACYNSDASLTMDPKGYFGQAQWRLSTFMREFDPSIWSEQSICDAAAYPNVLNRITNQITNGLFGDCLSVKPDLDQNGVPACEVGFVDASAPTPPTPPFLPVCSTPCCNAWASSAQPVGPYGGGSPPAIQKDPSIISACTPETSDCYCAVPSQKGLCGGTVLASIWRVGDALPPTGKIANFLCTGTFPPGQLTN